jgi:uncharacterized membrane protein
MFKGKKIAVIVPAYNEEKLIGKTLRTIPEYADRIYVIDDASTDNTGVVIIGIVNHENEVASYSLRVVIDGTSVPIYSEGTSINEINMIELNHEEKWEKQVGFAPQHTGEDQKVEFILLKDGELAFDSPLHLWIDVRE